MNVAPWRWVLLALGCGQSGGHLRSLAVPAVGEIVDKGQVLARIYDPNLRAILEELRVARSLDDAWRSAVDSETQIGAMGHAGHGG